MSTDLIELYIFGEIINGLVVVDYYGICIFIGILLLFYNIRLYIIKLNEEIDCLRERLLMNEEINHNVFKNISEKVNNVNHKIDKWIIDIMEDMNYEMDGFKAQMITSELTTDKIFKSINDKIYELEEFRTYQFEDFKAFMNTTIDDKFCSFNEKIDENCSIMNSVTERIDNFELNSQNNNIVIGISYNPNSDYQGFRNHKQIYLNVLSDNIELKNTYMMGDGTYNAFQLYITEFLKLKNLKSIKLNYSLNPYPNNYNHMFMCNSGDISCGVILTCDYNSKQAYNIFEKEIFEPYRPKHYNDIKYFDGGLINTSIEIIAKLLKLKVFNALGEDCTEIVYEKVKSDKRKYDFLELFFKEMGYISS